MHQSFTILWEWIKQKSLISAALIFIFWDMTWICGLWKHERDVFLKKGGDIDAWYGTLFIGSCIIVLCFRFQCMLSRLSENWSLLRKPKVWLLFSKLEGRKCSNRGKITRNPKILSVQFEHATCSTTFYSLYWKHKHLFPLFPCTVK